MSDIDWDNFEVAINARVRRSLDSGMQGVFERVQQRAGVGGDIFKFPSGETAASGKLIEDDPGNIRGWRWRISFDSPGAFFTNLGEVLRPLPTNARQLLTWRSKSNGQWYSKKEVDMRPYKDWVRKTTIEELQNLRASE